MKKILILLFATISLFGQINISRVSFDFGYVRNYQSFGSEYSYSPEIKIGGNFLTDIWEWEVHTSYWDDGVNEELEGISDHTTFSYSNFTFGGKLYFIPSQLRFHLFLNGGLSYNHIYQEYIGGGFSGIPYDDQIYHIISLDLGVGFRYNINSNFRIRTELNGYFALNDNIKQHNRFSNGAVKIGVDYFFN